MVIDCSLYFNEASLFKLRYRELKESVDAFIVLEGMTTFSGKFKPRNFPEVYEQWPTVIYRPINVGKQSNAWVAESSHRNALFDIINSSFILTDDDVIILSDADEIVHPDCIRRYTEEHMHDIVVCEQLMSYYYLNVRSTTAFQGTRITTVKTLRERCQNSFQNLRIAQGTVVNPGGWHFSFMGGTASIQDKLQAYAHTEYSRGKWVTTDHIEQASSNMKDLFDRDLSWNIVGINHTFPRELQHNQAEYVDLIRGV